MILAILFTLALAQEKPACSVTQISTGAKAIITLKCRDKRKLIDLPADSWGAYGRKDVRLRIDSDAAERIAVSGDIEPLRRILTTSEKGFLLRIPADTFIRWLIGEVESPDVRTHVYYAITGCPWGRPGEIDPRQCVRVR